MSSYALYLCGLCKCVLCAFRDGAKVSAIYYSKTSHRRNNQQHKACKTGGHVELEEEREERTAVNGNKKGEGEGSSRPSSLHHNNTSYSH